MASIQRPHPAATIREVRLTGDPARRYTHIGPELGTENPGPSEGSRPFRVNGPTPRTRRRRTHVVLSPQS
jgi:hypothetical protein